MQNSRKPKLSQEEVQRILANNRDKKAQTDGMGMSLMPHDIKAVKEKPYTVEVRGRHVGDEAKALIARRGLVGVGKIKESKELDIYDGAPIPVGEYMILPLSLVKAGDGLANLRVAEIGTKVIYQADVTIHNASTAIPISPSLTNRNFATCLEIQNQGANPMYFCYDGIYDSDAQANVETPTVPASGVGVLLPGSGSYVVEYLVQLNPRFISPSGDQTINIVISR